MYRSTLFIFMLLLSSILPSANSQTPLSPGFTYQGHLNQNGVPVDGAVNLRFSLWDAATNGAQIGTSLPIADVPVANGVFTVLLNASGEFGPTAFNGEARWLQIEVCNNAACDTPTRLDPRQEITPAPYALHALSAHWGGLTGVPAGLADGVDNSGDPVWGETGANISYTNGKVAIGASEGNHQLRVSGGPGWTTHFWSGSLELDNASAIGWRPNVLGKLFGVGQTNGGLYFFRTEGDTGTTGSIPSYDMTISDFGTIGIGAGAFFPGGPLPSYPLTIHTDTSGFSSPYGWVHTDGVVELGSYLSADAGWLGTRSNHPLHLFTNNSTARVTLTPAGNLGVGTSMPNPASQLNVVTSVNGNAAVRGESPNGNGMVGISDETGYGATAGVNSAGGGIGVYGQAHAGVAARGVWGESNEGTGVYGTSASAQGTDSAGVLGRNSAENGTGVIGECNSGFQAYGVLGISNSGYGVYGNGNSVGVYGIASGDPGSAGIQGVGGVSNSFAGYFDGNVFVDGELSTAAKSSVRIDHPLDPDSKYLSHSSVESSELKNMYDGVVTTDASGYAEVDLPEWFEALNRDFRYQLTVIGEFAQSIVSKEIENNSFEIQTDKPNVKVSWQVTGIRNDAYAKANPIEVEQLKSPKERGNFLAPELYGQPKEKGIHYRADLGKTSTASKSTAKENN